MARWTSFRWGLQLTLLLATVCVAIAGGTVTAQGPAAAAGADQPRVGKFVRLSPPLTKGKDRVQRIVTDMISAAAKSGARPVFIFEIEPGQLDYGEALNLARFISSPTFSGATTIAYLPQSITGHGVLLALACDEIVMSPSADLGDAGRLEPTIDEGLRNNYQEIAARRRTIPPAVAIGMLDAAVEVVQVETDLAREFVLAVDLPALKKAKPIRTEKVLKKSGAPGIFTAKQLRELGFVSYLATDRRELAQVWKLPAEALHDVTAPDGDWRTARFELHGVVTADKVAALQRLIDAQIRDRDVNFILLWIDSPGGSLTESMNLANYLARLDSKQRRTVAYIPTEARSDAAFVALACDQIVLHPRAILGGGGASGTLTAEERQLASPSAIKLARQKLRSPALCLALLGSPDVVFRYTRKSDGLVDFFTANDLERRDDRDQWQQTDALSLADVPLRLDGHEALELELATYVVDDLAGLRARYGLERDPQLVEPSWVTALVTALNAPELQWLLLAIGFVALYAEFHTPGVGLGGIIGALCFVLYFWSANLGGTAGWLEVLLFITGVVLILLEIFIVPGITVFGLSGGLLVVASLVLASQTFVLPQNDYQTQHLKTSLLVIVGAAGATIAAAVVLNRYLPHTPLFNRMLLQPPTGQEATELAKRESLAQFDHLQDRDGQATTPLTPSGKARIGDELVDVMTAGEFIDRGQKVVVTEVRGSRVIVRAKV